MQIKRLNKYKTMKVSNKSIVLRIISSPFLLMMLLVFHIYTSFKNTYLFIRYGGEWMTYDDTDKPTIYKIYQELKAK
jgi:hypothetical protein